MKTVFYTEHNTIYPETKGVVSIIGEGPENKPYLSITFQLDGSEICSGWLPDKDLERFAVNILKALDSDYIKPLWARNSSWGKTKTGRLKKKLKP